ncbi:MAG: hypothetical protein IJM81_03995 [Prevotella sp.]|nr:hypothetical protein [Prevotella sp.]
MKKAFNLLWATLLLAFVIVACDDKKPKNEQPTLSGNLEMDDGADSTVYGRYLEGGMSMMVLLTDNGDTVEYYVEDKDSMVKGGCFEGDRMAIIGYKADGENVAQHAVNLNSLQGKWSDIAKSFEIKEGGVVESNVPAESKPYTKWKIYNGQLILNTDTFGVVALGPDSLWLESDKGIFQYKRQK